MIPASRRRCYQRMFMSSWAVQSIFRPNTCRDVGLCLGKQFGSGMQMGTHRERMWNFSDSIGFMSCFVSLSISFSIAVSCLCHFKLGTATQMLFPPTCICTNPDCTKQGSLLCRKDEPRKVVLFTLGEGACLTYSIHLVCHGILFSFVQVTSSWSIYRL